MQTRYQIIGAIALFLLGIGIGYAIGFTREHSLLAKSLNTISPLREHDPSYKFIEPLLAYIIPSATQEPSLVSLQQELVQFIESEKQNGLVGVSVFFSDLNRGRWIGVVEDVKYSPASMLKVVIMLTYFKDAEKNQLLLQKELVYTESIYSFIKKHQFILPSMLEVGKSYSIESLIEKLIIDSDNGAEILLLENINQETLVSVYNALKIENPQQSEDYFTISPRTYSFFFRILYSATYLNKDMSEKALEILTRTTFKDGLVARLPHDIVVSHKYGEHTTYVNNTTGQVASKSDIELHDCGIIYAHASPYFLCVMTRGRNSDGLAKVIKKISEMIYERHKAQHKEL